MNNVSHKRAIANYRKRLSERGMARFEILGRDADRDLLRAVAKRLAGEGPEAAALRTGLGRALAVDPPKTGGILEALRRSPLVGADLTIARPRLAGRKVDL